MEKERILRKKNNHKTTSRNVPGVLRMSHSAVTGMHRTEEAAKIKPITLTHIGYL